MPKITGSGFRDVNYYNPDELLQQKGGLKLYKLMMLDDVIQGTFRLKAKLALSYDFKIIPASKSQFDLDICDFVSRQLLNIQKPISGNRKISHPLTQIIENILVQKWAFGFSVSELVWMVQDGAIELIYIKPKYPDLIHFHYDDFDNLDYIYYGRNYGTNIKIDPEKLLIAVNKFENGNWYGQSENRHLYMNWYNKTEIKKMRNIGIDKRSFPVIISEFDEKMPKELYTALEQSVINSKRDSAIFVPSKIGADQKLIPYANIRVMEYAAGQFANYEEAINNENTAIRRAMLIPDKVGFTDSDGGSYALGKEHADLLYEHLFEIQKDIINDITGQVIERLVYYNFGNVDCPKMEFDTDEGATSAKANIVKTLVMAGLVNPKESWIRKFISIPENTENLPLPEPAQSKGITLGGSNNNSSSGNGASEKDLMNTKLETENYSASIKLSDRIDFDTIEKSLDYRENEAREIILPAVEEIRLQWLNKIKTKKIIENKDLKALKDINPSFGTIKDALNQMMIGTYFDGKHLVSLETKKIAKKFKSKTDYYTAVFMTSNPELYTVKDEVLETTKKWIAEWVNKYGLELNAADIKKIKEITDTSFQQIGAMKSEIQNKINKIFNDQMGRFSNEVILQNLNSVFDAYRNTGEIDGGSAAPYRIDNLIRTNCTRMFNSGRNNMALDPDLNGFYRAARYSATIDQRTTDFCREHNGQIVMMSSPDFAENTPPNHYGCRSVMGPYLTEYDKFEETWTDYPERPDF